jgi:hypothetical protein
VTQRHTFVGSDSGALGCPHKGAMDDVGHPYETLTIEGRQCNDTTRLASSTLFLHCGRYDHQSRSAIRPPWRTLQGKAHCKSPGLQAGLRRERDGLEAGMRAVTWLSRCRVGRVLMCRK